MKKLKIGEKNITLIRGKAARVYHSEKTPCIGKPFRFWRIVDGEPKSTWHAPEELEKIQNKARNINAAAERVGIDFAAPSNAEREALTLWRAYAFKYQPKRPFVQILHDALLREKENQLSPIFEDIADAFFAEKQEKGLSPEYLRNMSHFLSFFKLKFKTDKLSEITAERVKSILPKRFSQKTRRHYLACIREIFTWHFKRVNADLRPQEKQLNPLETLELPAVSKNAEPEILTVEDGRKFFDVAKTRPDYELAFALCAFAGLRVAELARLKWKDIKEDEIFLSCSITKTKIARVIPICDSVRRRIRERGNANEYILNTAEKERQRIKMFNEARSDVAKKAGITIPFNAFRHTAVSALSRVHGNAVAADICGHDIRTAGVYYRTAMSKADAAAWLTL